MIIFGVENTIICFNEIMQHFIYLDDNSYNDLLNGDYNDKISYETDNDIESLFELRKGNHKCML